MKKIILSDVDRETLNEGRSAGLGSALAIKVNENTFKCTQPISACKDFLNDELWSARKRKNYKKYGQLSKPTPILKDKQYGYLVLKMLPPFGRNNFNDQQKKEDALLRANYRNIGKLVRRFERKFNIPPTSQIYKTNLDGVFLLQFNKAWYKNTGTLSLLGLIVRNAFQKDHYELSEFLKKPSFGNDTMNMKKVVKNIDKCKTLFKKYTCESDPHNKGIVYYLNKYENN